MKDTRTAAGIKAGCEERNLDPRHAFGLMCEYAEALERRLAQFESKSGTNEFVPFGEGYPPFSDLRRRHPAEATLRRLLAMNYSGPALYGDDGELQDSRMPMIDFQRDSVEDIERKIYERGMAEYAKQLHKPVPSAQRCALEGHPLCGKCGHRIECEDCEDE